MRDHTVGLDRPGNLQLDCMNHQCWRRIASGYFSTTLTPGSKAWIDSQKKASHFDQGWESDFWCYLTPSDGDLAIVSSFHCIFALVFKPQVLQTALHVFSCSLRNYIARIKKLETSTFSGLRFVRMVNWLRPLHQINHNAAANSKVRLLGQVTKVFADLPGFSYKWKNWLLQMVRIWFLFWEQRVRKAKSPLAISSRLNDLPFMRRLSELVLGDGPSWDLYAKSIGFRRLQALRFRSMALNDIKWLGSWLPPLYAFLLSRIRDRCSQTFL